MAYPPTVSDFKFRFVRDFKFSDGPDNVMDADIVNALADAVPLFNQSLWSSPAEISTAYLFLAAHMLVLNIQAAGGASAIKLGKGLGNTGGGVISSKSVGSLNVAYAIPERVANSPVLSQFMKTDYGQRYLHMVAPRLVGNVSIAGGPVDFDVAVGDASQT